MRRIGSEHVDDLALGGTFLGSGGGGDPFFVSVMASQALEHHGPVDVVDPAELPAGAMVVPIAMIGAPTVIVEKLPNGRELVDVLRGIERYRGARADAVMPCMVGGVNTLMPLAVAAELGLPLVDADLIRRTFPQLEQTVFTLAGISASPIALADEKGNLVVLEATDNATAEKLARAVTMAMGASAAVAMNTCSGADVRAQAIHGSLRYCAEVGRGLSAVRAGRPGALDALLAHVGGGCIFAGRVIEVDRQTTGGFARGTVVMEHLEDASRTLRVEFQNENLVAFEDGVALVTVPDLICILDGDTAEPITTERVSYGQRVSVLAIPAAERWRTPAGVAIAGPAAFGYDIEYRRFSRDAPVAG